MLNWVSLNAYVAVDRAEVLVRVRKVAPLRAAALETMPRQLALAIVEIADRAGDDTIETGGEG